METVYLKDLKRYSISEIMNFREKYKELMEKKDAGKLKPGCSQPPVYETMALENMLTREKILIKRSKVESEICNKKSKNERKELPALLPISIPDDESVCTEPCNDLIPGKDVVFIFKVYPPYSYDSHSRPTNPKHNMEIVMLGHQTLNLLCDQIVCTESFMEVGGDISENPDIPVRTRLGEKYKSRMLYIGNTFYIDKSDPTNKDYSEAIRRWGEKERLELGETLNMHQQTCLDLVARIGFPYVFQHIGGCEHILRIEYARLLEAKDCLESKYYPFYNYLTRTSAKLCMACMELSHWIVFDSPRMISNPSFLCDTCFRSYHYINGQKIGTFSAVRYWDSPVFANMFDDICKEQSAQKLSDCGSC